MSTVVKTGVVLLKQNEPYPHYISDSYGIATVYGDLHVVGRCCILYYPANQVKWGASHGWINLEDPFQRNFQRDTEPFKIFVIPANRVTLRRDCLHPDDLAKFIEAGGGIMDTRGEMG